MVPRDKAYELINEFRRIEDDGKRAIKIQHAKICAMICVKEFLKFEYPAKAISYEDKDGYHYTTYYGYWAEVLLEINSL